MSEQYRIAPKGFTPEQWEQFMEEGFLVIENALSDNEVEYYLDAIDRFCASASNYKPDQTFGPQNIVEKDPAFTELIDHPRHIGYVYDVYGELLQLLMSQFFLRPRGGRHNAWHHDGARLVPYGVYCGHMPMQIKVGYWLTDLPEPKMGNFVCLPGSHRSQDVEAYTTHESLPGEKILCCPAGTMTLMHASIWHRVEPNETDVVRKNIFLSYSPAWVRPADRHYSDSEWLKTLNREQRIIMRSYPKGYDGHKPPKEDVPLFLDRETGLDADRDADQNVPVGIRKRRTTIEKWQMMGITSKSINNRC